MATVEVRPVPAPPKEYVLTLSEYEAEVLHLVTGKVIGVGSIREATGAIFYALRRAGVASDREQANGFIDTGKKRGN